MVSKKSSKIKKSKKQQDSNLHTFDSKSVQKKMISFKDYDSPIPSTSTPVPQISPSSPKKEKKEKKPFFNKDFFKNKKQSFLKNLKLLSFGFFSVIFSILISYFLFKENMSVFVIILTTLFLMPVIHKNSRYKEIIFGHKKEIKKDGVKIIQFSPPSTRLKISEVHYENQNLIDVYLLLFLGVLIGIFVFILIASNSVSSEVFSNAGWNNNLMPLKQFGFENQNKLDVFKDISINNISIIFVCFLFALIFPSAGILIIIWNAVFWGVVFTQFTLWFSMFHKISFSISFLSIFFSALPHMVIEVISYFLATIAGIFLAFSIKDYKDVDKFLLVSKYVIVLLAIAIVYVLIGSVVEIYLFDFLKNLFLGL